MKAKVLILVGSLLAFLETISLFSPLCRFLYQRSCLESQVFFKNLTDCHDESTVLLSHNNLFAFEAVRVIGDVYFPLFALRSL